MDKTLEELFDDAFGSIGKISESSTRYLIVPPFIFELRKKPKWYMFYSKKKKLYWLKHKRRISLMFEAIVQNTTKLIPSVYIKESQ